MPLQTRQEIEAAVAAVSQGQLPQMRILVEGLLGRIEELESKDVPVVEQGQVSASSGVSSIQEAEPPADDAKSVDVRESVIALTERFNQLLGALKGQQ